MTANPTRRPDCLLAAGILQLIYGGLSSLVLLLHCTSGGALARSLPWTVGVFSLFAGLALLQKRSRKAWLCCACVAPLWPLVPLIDLANLKTSLHGGEFALLGFSAMAFALMIAVEILLWLGRKAVTAEALSTSMAAQ